MFAGLAGGLLLLGMVIQSKSGCGKSRLAHYIGYQYRSNFKFISISCADLVNKVKKYRHLPIFSGILQSLCKQVVGESEKKISSIFAAGVKEF